MLLLKTSWVKIFQKIMFLFCCAKQTNTCKYNLQNIQISFDINQTPMNVKKSIPD